MDIGLKLKTLPEKPGVYQYFDKNGTILYVGKAKNLKKRVSSYFNKNHDHAKTQILVRKIADIQYIVVDTEMDALLLENNLIKKYLPKYNIQLKDDKTYPWICIKKEPFPRVFSTRLLVKDGSKYFGPYPSGRIMHALLDLIRDLFPLRTCALDLATNKIEKGNYKVCLEYHIGKCKGPCEEKQTAQVYNGMIDQIEGILKGNIYTVIQNLKQLMLQASADFRFEEAHDIKTRIELLEKYKAKSTVVSPTIHQVDVVSMVEDNDTVFVNYLVINHGAIIHGITVEVKRKLDETQQDIITFVLPELRERFQSNATEILVEADVDWEMEGVRFFAPQRGDKKALIDLSLRNAKFYRLEKIKQEKIKDPEKHTNRILETMKTDLRLKELPAHIECFDNSNIQGTNPVSACVVFKDAKPSKKDYRHFNVQTVEGPDDFATMREAVYRRYRRLLEEEQPLPQLIIIDGGKGQLSAALEALEKLDLRGKIAIIGIAKRLEELFYPGDSLPLYLDKRSETLKVIQHLRNEAHRFGITHHRNRRSKSALSNELEEIPGIGEKTVQDLIKAFKSVKRVKEQSEESLAAIVGKAKAQIIRSFFNSNS
ncbi:excinuclease ABC subunit UvrC [Fluviicola taffensis]|uniref:UvrABC system protein C n=1 Tax=Fluviicola taffensis (strain DSM 16823 / NCIMB 13979 / RW262) TaxID=755732 RepID=F2IF90_FLUTR|nr:excinuclease ABC subunit UvrC [Fluviicola taffensis]AEA43564.1 UvrABC system protein C [Fluviicola taffensis DSM 16823]